MSAGSWMSCTRMSPLSQCLPTTLAGTRSAPAARDTRAAVYRAPYSAGRRLSLIPPSTDTYSRVSRSSTVTGFTVPTVYRVSVVGPTIARPGSTEIRGTVVPSSAQVASTTPATLTGHLMPEVDLGGGFGIAYTPGEVDLRHQVAGERVQLGTQLEHPTCRDLEARRVEDRGALAHRLP